MFAKSAIALAIIAGTAFGALAAPRQDWTNFAPADRTSCLWSTGATGTYTDLLKCLENKRDARQLLQKPDMPGVGTSD